MLLLDVQLGEEKHLTNIGPDIVIQVIGIKNNRVYFGVGIGSETQTKKTQPSTGGTNENDSN